MNTGREQPGYLRPTGAPQGLLQLAPMTLMVMLCLPHCMCFHPCSGDKRCLQKGGFPPFHPAAACLPGSPVGPVAPGMPEGPMGPAVVEAHHMSQHCPLWQYTNQARWLDSRCSGQIKWANLSHHLPCTVVTL